jgi:2-polyprenyl-3-methyl-5-hydroxy-6-metoxy-1,4-benzoquinol methylase
MTILTDPFCPICSSTRHETIEEAEYPYRVLKCVECDMVYVHPLPDAEELSRHYDAGYYFGWISVQKKTRERMWARRLKVIRRWAEPGSLLDVGCGEGLFLEVAKNGGWQAEGTELSSHAADFASRRLQQPIFCGEVWQADFAPRNFNVVTMWHVLEHTTQPLRILSAVKGLLKPGGYLVLAVPNVNDFVMQVAYLFTKGHKQRLFSLKDKEVHLFHFSEKTLRTLLTRAGFECLTYGPDFGIVDPAKKLINGLGVAIHRVMGAHVYNSIQVIAQPASRA